MTEITATATAYTPSLANNSAFAPESRVWVYTANRPLTAEEVAKVQAALDAFARQWTSHDLALKAAAEVYANQFVILMADETQTGVGGCSIDRSMHFLERLGQETGVDFFDRMRFAWVENDRLCFANRDEFAEQVKKERITTETPVVNTLAQTKRDLAEKWLLPYGQSWHRRVV